MTQKLTPHLAPHCMPEDGLHIAVFGATNLDISAGSANVLQLGDSTPGHIHTTAGGVARNIAENLARLGHKTCLVSAVGDDLHGQFLLDHTRIAGVDVSMCSMWPGHRSGSYVSISNPDASLLAAVNDMDVLELLTPEELMRHAGVFCDAKLWVMDCNLSEALLAWLIQNKNNIPVFVDGVSSQKCIKVANCLSAINTLKINRLEAKTLTGLPVDDTAQVITAAQTLCANGVENVVVSLGSAGVCWHQRSSNTSGHAAAIAVKAVSSNGAGDALTAGLVHGALAGWPLDQSVRFGIACAALTMLSASANHPQLSVASATQLVAESATGLIQP